MAGKRWKAIVGIVVAGEPVKAGATFTAPAEHVADALARGLVVAATDTGGKRAKS